VRVLLADDHALFRAGIASLLRAWGLDVVGHASDGNEAVEQARRLRPDLVLMDVTMPHCDGIEATRRLKEEVPGTRVVMVTVADDDDSLFEAIKSGAEGYLLKDMTEAELGRTLEALAAGRPALSPALALRIIDEFARGGKRRDGKPAALTPRESEVLRLLADGCTNRQIATALAISENTVSFHVKNVLAKLQVKNRAQAAVYAVTHKIR
jgi:DNA-binding NarL/FixJ family response regulator